MSLATAFSSKLLRSARTQLRAESFRPMTVLSKQSAEEYKKLVGSHPSLVTWSQHVLWILPVDKCSQGFLLKLCYS